LLDTPSISVVLPVYNVEWFIAEAINSILQQSFHDFELIIINDGSTDRTNEIIYSFIDPRIIISENLKNLGLIYSLNKGIELAKGKFIARIDADDISRPDRFEKQLAFLEQNPDCVAVGSSYLPIDDKAVPVMAPITRPRYPITAEWFMVIGCPIAHPSVMYRTDIARQIGGYDPQFIHTEDYEFWTRMIEHGDICSLPEALLLYRVGDQNRISEKYSRLQYETTLKIRQHFFLTHFGQYMSAEVSEVIQTNGTKGNDADRFKACQMILMAYHQILQSKTINQDAKIELETSVGYYLEQIRSFIFKPEYYFIIAGNPIEIKKANIVHGTVLLLLQKAFTLAQRLCRKLWRKN